MKPTLSSGQPSFRNVRAAVGISPIRSASSKSVRSARTTTPAGASTGAPKPSAPQSSISSRTRSALCTPIHALDDFLDPNVVKLVMREDGAALYFSRAPIPWHRDGAAAGIASQTRFAESLRHLGIYAYRCRALSALSAAAPCPLEHAERLEQLRAMWLGMTILAAVAVEVPGHGVDTPAQLEAVRERLAGARARGRSP